jgi:putative transposase
MLREIRSANAPGITISKAAELLSVNRTSLYYTSSAPSDTELAAKNLIDELHTAHPAWGSRQLSGQLKAKGLPVGRLKTRRYMSEMGVEAIYPKPNLSKASKQHTKYPYLLRHFVPTRPNQAWSIDITYIRLRYGFIYLCAIIDWYSRMIVASSLDDTLGARIVTDAIKKAFEIAKPEILNSDQGSQFTSDEYIRLVESNRVKISMDGKGRWADNIPIERWFRTLKYEEVYLKDYENIKEARREIGKFIKDYNFKRIHSAIDTTPAYSYYPTQLHSMLHPSPCATLDRTA